MSKSQQHAARKPATKFPNLRKKIQQRAPTPKTAGHGRKSGRG